MRGSTIGPLNVPVRGKRFEGVIQGSVLPGTVVEIVPGSSLIGGRHRWRASLRAAGKSRPPVILLEDSVQGFPVGTAYTDNTHCFLYVPAPGDEMNVFVDVPGTGTSSSGGAQVGEYLIYNNNGHLTVETGSPETTPWQSLENVADVNPGVAQLTWIWYGGG